MTTFKFIRKAFLGMISFDGFNASALNHSFAVNGHLKKRRVDLYITTTVRRDGEHADGRHACHHRVRVW